MTTDSKIDLLRLVVRCVDLTTLEGSDTPERVRRLCATARRPEEQNNEIPPDARRPAEQDGGIPPVAAVCVYPLLVAVAKEALAGSPVKVASVAGAFPSGLSSIDVRVADIRHAVSSGADEIDIVLNRSAFLSGDHPTAASDIEASKAAAGAAKLKVILEVGELETPERITAAANLAMGAGADTIKSSTGKIAGGATPQSIRCMAEAIRDHAERTGKTVGLKISGGVRTSADALDYLAIVEDVLGTDWFTPDRLRFGASSLLTDLVQTLQHP